MPPNQAVFYFRKETSEMDENTQEQILEVEGTELQGEANVPQTPETTTPTGLTKDDILAIIEANNLKVADQTAKAFRAQQSMFDKKARAIANDAKQHLQILKEEGAQITPEMESAYVNRQVNSFLQSMSNEQPEAAQPETQSKGVSQELLDAAKYQINDMVEASGIKLTSEHTSQLDAAWKNVKDGASYARFLKDAAVILKPKAGKETPPQAKIASVVSGQGTYTPTKEALTAELQKLLEHPHPKNMKRIEELQEKLKT
jgi:glycyl-tRNA synthetase beta subunit